MRIMSKAELFNKALRVIVSCSTSDHTEAAQRYAMLYFNRTRDIDNLRILIEELNRKIESLQISS